MTYVARINWDKAAYHRPPTPETERWNMMLARCVSVFGLPGGRYRTRVALDYMDFIFDSDQDRLLFLAGWPAYIPKGEQHD